MISKHHMNATWRSISVRRYWRHVEDTGRATRELAATHFRTAAESTFDRRPSVSNSEHIFYQWRKRLAPQLPAKFTLVETGHDTHIHAEALEVIQALTPPRYAWR